VTAFPGPPDLVAAARNAMNSTRNQIAALLITLSMPLLAAVGCSDGSGAGGGTGGAGASSGGTGGDDGTGASNGGAGGDGGDGPAVGLPCQTSDQCEGALVCDRWAGVCAVCRTTLDCPSGQRCSAGSCVDTPSCSGDLDCSAQGMLCDQDARRCVECNSAADCAGEKACLGKSCKPTMACDSSLDCTPNHMLCGEAVPPEWPLSYLGKGCMECAQSSDCPSSTACTEGLCYDVCAAAGRICGDFMGVSCGACSVGECSSIGSGCVRAAEVFLSSGLTNIVPDGDLAFLGFRGDQGDAPHGSIHALDRTSGTTRLLAQRGAYVDDVATNTTRVFWAEPEAVMSVAKTGGAPVKLATIHEACWEIEASDEWVICALRDYDNGTDGLYKISIATGALTALWSGNTPDAIRLVGDRVYFSASEGGFFSESFIGYVSLSGGPVQQIARAQASELYIAGGFLYWSDWANEPRVARVPVDGGAIEDLGSYQIYGAAGEALYVSDADRSILQASLDLKTTKPVLGPDDIGSGASAFAVDARGLLWGSGGFGFGSMVLEIPVP
jgi:hypothetical protein